MGAFGRGNFGAGPFGAGSFGGISVLAPPATITLSAPVSTIATPLPPIKVMPSAALITLFGGVPVVILLGGGVAGFASHRVARASYRLQIAWNAYNVGLLTFDRSNFDGPDVFGSSPLDVTFGGVYDDVSAYVRQADWSRGRDDNLTQVVAGEATFELRDPGWTSGGVWHPGLFNPDNPLSPLYGQLEDRLHPVRWEGTFLGNTRGLFAGWARRLVWRPSGTRGRGNLTVECADLFYWLDRANPVIVGTGPTTTGAAIGLILDAIGLNDAGMRDLDVGDTIPDFYADGSKSGTRLIQDLLDAERGMFFIAGGGRATFRSRLSRILKTSAWTLRDRMIDAAPGVDFDQAKTRVSVTWVDSAGAPIWFSISTSTAATIGKIGLADLPEIQTTYLTSTSQADSLAGWILSQVESPRPPMYAMTIDNRDADLLTQILTRELVDRITATESSGGTTGDYHIDRLTHSYRGGSDDGRHTASWLLSRVSPIDPAIFDVSTFDSSAQFVY